MQIKLDTITLLLERLKSQNTHPELQECEMESLIHAGGNKKCYGYFGDKAKHILTIKCSNCFYLIFTQLIKQLVSTQQPEHECL